MRSRVRFLSASFFVLAAAELASAQDRLALGSVNAPTGASIVVPLTLRDRAGTPVGNDLPAGAKLQAFSVRVSWTPATAFTSGTFARAGIVAALPPIFESAPTASGSASYLAVWSESTAGIPWTGGDDLVANLTLAVSPTLSQGAVVVLTIDPTASTTAGNQAGTISETVGAGTLEIASGSVTVCGSSVVPAVPVVTSPASSSSVAGGNVTLQWGAVTDAARYAVRLGTTNPPPYAAEVVAPGTSFSAPLTPSASWYWSVESIPAAGGVAPSTTGAIPFSTLSGSPRFTVSSTQVVPRWGGATPLTFSGAGLDTGTLDWLGPSASPGVFAPTPPTSSALSGTLTPDPAAKAGWYAPVLTVSGTPVASFPRGLALRAFSDVPENTFYFEASDRVVANGVMDGFTGPSGPEFRPNQAITRAEMADGLVRAHYRELGQSVPAHSCASYFPDVPCVDPRNAAVELAKELGITNGGADGLFHPDSGVTRAEMAAFLDRLEYGGDPLVPKCVPDPGWSDLGSIPAWARPYVHLLRSDRTAAGCSASPLTYCPLLGMTRGELATFLSRILGDIPKP